MIYVIIFLVCTGCMLAFARLFMKYRNPYKLYMVFGKKGSGKTTLMTKLSIQYRKKGWNVYCDRELPGCYRFDTSDFGRVAFPPTS